MQTHYTKEYGMTNISIPPRSRSEAIRVLKAEGYTDGLIHSIESNNESFALRIWVVDNSGSMVIQDGHSLYKNSLDHVRTKKCSRWDEIVDTVNYHATLAALLEAPTIFKLLNPTPDGLREFSIATRGSEYIPEDLEKAKSIMKNIVPRGRTPLSERVQEIASYIESRKDELHSKGQKVSVVLATDGLPNTNGGQPTKAEKVAFKNSLRLLQGLPVWVVIRLCTDDEEVVEFYNNLDYELEMSLEVLDDYFAEALEVHEVNPWINYTLPIHRMREMGFHHKIFDLIDERQLTKDELPEFFRLLYGAGYFEGVPDPQLDWKTFQERIADVTTTQPTQFHPVKRELKPLISTTKLGRSYGKSGKLFLLAPLLGLAKQ